MKKLYGIALILILFLGKHFPAFASEPSRIEGFGLIGDFTVTQGEAYDPHAFAPQVNVLLEGGTKVRMAVRWVARERDARSTGYTEFDGFVDLPADGSITNEENKTAYMRVFTARGDALRVRRIEVVPDIKVPFGEPENLIPFPGQVRIDLSDNTQRTLPIRFKANEPYRPLEVGAYQFIGMVDLPEDGSIRLDERNSVTLRVMVQAAQESEVVPKAGESSEALNPGLPPSTKKVPLIFYMMPLGIVLLLFSAFYLSTRIKK